MIAIEFAVYSSHGVCCPVAGAWFDDDVLLEASVCGHTSWLGEGNGLFQF